MICGLLCSVRFTPLLTPLCHFTWPTTLLFPVAFHFVIILLTVDHGIFRRKEMSQMDLLHRWQPIMVPRLNSLSS
ncbi:unnamed protein product [Staurois parvus]|uniref:NADH dehydrogenase subunit 4 n=1 Tax=Staurois parvus TaxID=386267 RepID=A0ABN9B3B1_9NEOB|nr:unnamed protein product [Staurois parvus]